MSEIFGIPMSSIMIVLVVLLAVCLSAVLWVALRRPVIFKMGVRNIPRRKAQTVLIVVGLMLSTLIIAAALGTGDTIDHSATLATYDTLGHADELVVSSRDDAGEGNITTALNERLPQSVADDIRAAFEGTDLIDGVMPVLIEVVPAVLLEGGRPAAEESVVSLIQSGRITQFEPVTYLGGIDPTQLDDFGGLKDLDGNGIPLGDIGDDEVVISEEMADALGAGKGDLIGVTYRNEPLFLTVAAVAEDSPLSGRFDTNTPGMVVPLERLQQATGQEGLVTTIAVSNRGGVREGLPLTDEVVDRLRAAFAGRPIGVDPIKQESIDLSKDFASIFTTFFLVFGLFSIAVGILLIVLIFTMLAAERRPEMGMARAVGQQRGQLIQQFVAEGSAYALVAGLVGAALGVGAAIAIALAFRPLFGDFFEIEPYVTPRSMIVAYSLGVVITFVTVVAASARVSRLNVVAAIRDTPEPPSHARGRGFFRRGHIKRGLVYTIGGLVAIGGAQGLAAAASDDDAVVVLASLVSLAAVVSFFWGLSRILGPFWGVMLVLVGAVATVFGQAEDSAFLFYGGMSLLPFGIALLLRFYRVPARPVFSLVGLYIVVLWLLPDDAADRLFGDLSGDIEMFFLSGIFMVAGATIVIVQNLDWLLAGVTALGGLFRSKLPAVRMAVAFPGLAKGRTGMTVAMFSLIVFSLVMFATINQNFVNLFLGDEANAGWDVRADQGVANPIGDTAAFVDLLEQRGVETDDFAATGRATTNFQASLRQPGQDEWKQYVVRGLDEGFLTDAEWSFQQRAEGYADDAAIIQALLTAPDVVVIDQAALEIEGGFGQDPEAFRLEDPDGEGPQEALTAGDAVFAPRQVEVQAGDGSTRTVTIIGVIDTKIGTLLGLYGRQELIDGVFPRHDLISYYVQLEDPARADERAKEIERALLINGIEATSIRDELEDQQQQNRAFLYIIQGFMGLGLIVGIAAVGVIAFRSVVERRQQIGVLRAIGYQRSLVSLAFLVETGFVVALGVVSGTGLGLVLARNLFADDEFAPAGTEFIVPWSIVAAILLITIVAALLMTLVPARQASALAPAEALRYE